MIFFGNHPFFINLGPDLERAGCKAVYFPQLREDRIGVVDLSVAKSGDKIDELRIGEKIYQPTSSNIPEVPTKVTEPSQALQYAKAYLEALGYKTSTEKR